MYVFSIDTAESGPRLVFSNSIYIQRLSLDGTRTKTVHSGLNSAFGVDFNYRFVRACANKFVVYMYINTYGYITEQISCIGVKLVSCGDHTLMDQNH